MTDKPDNSVPRLSPKAEETISRFDFTIQQSPEAVFWLEQSGKFSYVNNQACLSLGYTRDELLSLYLWDIDPDYPKDRWEQQWADMQVRGKYIFETRHKAPNHLLLDFGRLDRASLIEGDAQVEAES